MKYLLDVNVLIGAIRREQASHARIAAWLAGRELVLCPLAELGFLRITTHPKVFGFAMADARRGLEEFARERRVERIPDDLPALESRARTSDEVTDHYLANLAAKHGLKLATLDGQLRHPSAELVV